MLKTISLAVGLALFPVAAQAQSCGNVVANNAAVSNYAAVSCPAVQQQAVVANVAHVAQTTTYVPVQVVSPQIVSIAPQAVVTQNSYNQQVVGTAIVSQQGYAQATVTAQPPLVLQPQIVAAPLAVQNYNVGVATFQGTQNYVRSQAVVAHGYGYSNVANVNVQHQVINRNVAVQHQISSNVVQQNVSNGGGNRGGIGGLLNGIFGSKTVTKTVTKSRGF